MSEPVPNCGSVHGSRAGLFPGAGAERDLKRMHRAESGACDCGAPETPRHVFVECRRFEQGRPAMLNVEEYETIRYLRATVTAMWKEENARQRPSS